MITDQHFSRKREHPSEASGLDATAPKVTKMEDKTQFSQSSNVDQLERTREVIPPRLSTYCQKFEDARIVPNLNVMGLSKNIDFANESVKSRACSKLKMITDQVQFLQEQAEAILREASRDTMLHSVACNFVKLPGHVYHLYEKTDGQLYFSMLSPEEWVGMGPNQVHRGSYRLNYDQSWIPESMAQKNDVIMKEIEESYKKRVLGDVFSGMCFLEGRNNNVQSNSLDHI